MRISAGKPGGVFAEGARPIYAQSNVFRMKFFVVEDKTHEKNAHHKKLIHDNFCRETGKETVS